MEYKVIDNFLDKKYFDSLVELFTDKSKTHNPHMPWYLQTSVEYPKGHKNWKPPTAKIYYMYHMLYNDNMPRSSHYDKLIPLLRKLETSCLIRVKANFYPNTETLHEYQMHEDDDFLHSACVLSLNTCDGYTKFEDGTKINSVANRIVIFDASKKHCPTTTTNDYARFNININYIQEQFHEMV